MNVAGNPELLAANIRAGNRAALARAITLIESRRADHEATARELVQELLPATGNALRVGITGSPGVGKSTTIDALGMDLIARGHRVAVLAVDPSSVRSGGSILGDKTRMGELARDDRAYVRPSPSGGETGGVARGTREAILVCAAAGFDTILVETVGVGQAETAVDGTGIDDVAAQLTAHLEALGDGVASLRAEQSVRWLWSAVHSGLVRSLLERPGAQAAVDEIVEDVRLGALSAGAGADRMLRA